eukprot:CAMPEP_0115573588 /NCGR_PEP_ID=MMETSP0272-20121206/1078_1 /TAXON_ID=71861 /ORGANISM="Scrippsiella trochoidea, Strain CCMP3099" /LENGTH=348 /DNA_ID=CAMNT_0003008261 /DNA_START=116 /DNA_END=1161 /DNA_ORIENTATION=+
MDVVSRIEIFETIALGSSLILVSMSMIRFNKFLMHPDVFPHSSALTMIHMTTSLVVLGSLSIVKPQWFPGMANFTQKKELYLHCFVPLGIMFAVTLYTINQAYLYCSVTFLQFMKEANVGIGFIISWIVGLQKIDRVKTFIVLWIITSSCAAISGEFAFHWAGFFLQLTGQLCECTRAVLMEMILGGGEPVKDGSVELHVMMSLLVLSAMTWDDRIPERLINCWHYLVPNTILAIVLNLVLATCLTRMTAMGFLICGVVKDIVLVTVSAVVFREQVRYQQLYAFLATLVGVWLWASVQVSPNGRIRRYLQWLLWASDTEERAATERTALVQKARKSFVQGSLEATENA